MDDLHACILLVERADLTDQVALGCGSIVSTNRVLTAAHVVREATGVQAGFYQREIAQGLIRRADSTYVQPIQLFNDRTLHFDLAIVQFPDNSFHARNVIPIAGLTPVSGELRLAGYGFESPTATMPTLLPLLALLTVAEECTEARNATESHFCAVTTEPTVLCPGDNGAGIYTGSGATKELVRTFY